MQSNNRINRYVLQIKEEFKLEINENNYRDIIIEEIAHPKSYVDYINSYMEENKKSISLEWGSMFYLFLKHTRIKEVNKMEYYYSKLKRYPSNFLLETEMAEVSLLYYGDIFKARDGYLKALELMPKDSASHHRLGIIYNYLGIMDKSVEHNKIAVENSHNSYEPSETKARCLFNIAVVYINVYEDYAGAMKLLEEAIKEMPNYKQAKAALKQLRGASLWNKR